MANMDELYMALRNADKAGDVQSARTLAAYIKSMPADAPSAPVEKPWSVFDSIKQGAINLGAGAIRGAGSIGATILAPYDMAVDAIKGDRGPNLSGLVTGQRPISRNQERRQAMDKALAGMGAEPDSALYAVGKIGGEIAGTAGAGGVVANALGRVPAVAAAAPNLLQAVRSSGMVAGNTSGVANALTRAGGGAISGAAQAAMVNPSDVVSGAAIGAVTPGLLKLAGMAGAQVLNAVKGGRPNAGKMLADALGVTEAELPAMVAAANRAPAELVPGSKLTFSQALQTQGANTPGAKMLERVVSGGPGGDALLKRFADQGEARMAALQAQGAETYQGAAADLKTRAGDKIGAILRTQAGDDQATARAAWEALHGRAGNEGVALQLPLDEMQGAMGALGPGTVGAGKDAQALMREAQNIGTLEIPPITFGKASSGARQESLLDAVKRAGGINAGSVSSRMLGGEVAALRESGLGRVVYKNRGQSAAKMAEKMHEAGFLPDEDPATLLDLLRNAGASTFSRGANMDSVYRAAAERAMGDAPTEVQRVAVAAPFDAFQRLRRSAGELAAKPNISPAEANVLGNFKRLLEGRVDEAAQGNLLSGEVMPAGFRGEYNAARDMTRANAERYKAGNNITQILNRPVGQDYKLAGDEVTNKLWHGGAGLAQDVGNLKGVLSGDNYDPTMEALRKFIMTDAASKVTAGGNLGSALPKYVENRLPGLQEAMAPEQLNALSGVAADIRNAEAAASVPGLRGSDTQAKIARALDAGLLDSTMARALARVTTFKGLGIEPMRSKWAASFVESKGKTMAALLADPKAAAQALQDAAFISTADPASLRALQLVVSRGAPVLAASQSSP